MQKELRMCSARAPRSKIQFDGDVQLPPRSPMRHLIAPPWSMPPTHLRMSPVFPGPNTLCSEKNELSPAGADCASSLSAWHTRTMLSEAHLIPKRSFARDLIYAFQG